MPVNVSHDVLINIIVTLTLSSNVLDNKSVRDSSIYLKTYVHYK